MFEIVFSDEAVRELKKLDNETTRRLIRKIRFFEGPPSLLLGTVPKGTVSGPFEKYSQPYCCVAQQWASCPKRRTSLCRVGNSPVSETDGILADIAIEESATNPLHYFERLSGREEFKLRVGDYRVITNVLLNEKKVIIRSLGHRKNIYKK